MGTQDLRSCELRRVRVTYVRVTTALDARSVAVRALPEFFTILRLHNQAVVKACSSLFVGLCCYLPAAESVDNV
jgi:hypothetical protein